MGCIKSMNDGSKCGRESGNEPFCHRCEIDMCPKIYDCPRCKRSLATSHFEVACARCRTLEETQELEAKWPMLRMNY